MLGEIQAVRELVCESEVRLNMQETEVITEDSEEDIEDPSYVPESEVDTNSEDEEESSPVKQKAVPAKQVEGGKGGREEKRTKKQPPKPVKKIKLARSSDEEDESATSTTPSNPHGKRSHHVKRTCPVCQKEDTNLRRHLKTHVKKGQITKDAVERIFSVAIRQGKRRGPQRKSNTNVRRGLKLKWCPVKGCDAVTPYLRSHLTHCHRLKSGTLLENYLKVAREYEGRQEVDKMKREICQGKASTTSTATQTSSSTTPIPGSFTDATVTSYATPSDPSAPVLKLAVTATPAPSVSYLQQSERSDEASDNDDDDVNVDNDEDYPDPHREYFNATLPKNNRHKWLLAFYSYLNKADCGRKKGRNRLQHASQVRAILEDIDPGGNDINVLSKDEGFIVWTDWVDVKMDVLKSGTIRSYLGML